MHKFVIMFSGVPGSSKSQIAHHLSWNLGLPIFSNDILRTEVTANLGHFENDAYLKLRDKRLDQLMASGKSFIYDASVDRQWAQAKKWLNDNGYEHFVISFNLDRAFVERLYKAKSSTSVDMLDQWFEEHDAFLKEYPDVTNVAIDADNFQQRLETSLREVSQWVDTIKSPTA
jgi:predicted kinase